MGKNPQNYESVYNETSVYEQKPIKTDDFNEAEEKEVKERVEKRKIKRREIAEKKQLFFKKRKDKNMIKKQRRKCGLDSKI